MEKLFLLVLLGGCLQIFGQDTTVPNNVESRYFEDQFYFGVTYNFVRNKPDDVVQRNLSYGLQLGVIKDIPLNSKGTRALGVGLGVALNTYYSNLLATETTSGISYSLGESTDFKRSKLETHAIELPLEFRWRNSTREEYRFWRLYAGIKAAYILGARSTSVVNNTKNGFSNTDIERFQYGLMVNVGYNTFNIHLYYAFSELFKEGVSVNDQVIGYSPLRIGVIFYIL